MSKHIKYAVKRQSDGQYAVLAKNLSTKALTIESLHDTLDEAKEALDDIHRKPSQSEVLKFFNDLKDSINTEYDN
jgi:hypothetical protein